MSRNPIAVVWLCGVVLTVVVYAAGPEHVLDLVLTAFDQTRVTIADAIAALSVQALGLLRAAAIGLFAVFVALSVMAARRGLPARVALVVVSGLFLFLAGTSPYGSETRWFLAFVLALIGALSMTRRLTEPPRPHTGSPWAHGPWQGAPDRDGTRPGP